mgnify:CR=1 FL=1
MNKKITLISFLAFHLLQCGFEPIYSENSQIIESNYVPIQISENSYTVNKAFNAIFKNRKKQSDFQLRISIREEDLPVITNTDGTISKYRIDITTNFVLIDTTSDKEIFTDYSKGFAQYDTQINNYDTELKREEAKMIATKKALQLIPIKIQDFQSSQIEE